MLKSPSVRVLIGLAVLVLVGVAALALGSKQNVVISRDGRQAIATKGPSMITAVDSDSDAKLKTIAGNISIYPFGRYFCCFGNTIAGTGSQLGFEVWIGIPFTPSANSTVHKVKASVGWIVNTDTHFNLSIYSDSNGLPGKAIKTFPVSATSQFGACCTFATGNSAAGVPVSAGTQYWVVASTNDKKHGTFFGAWAFNSTDMRTHPLASWCSSTGGQCGSGNNMWSAGQGILPSFGVLGD